jgi:histidine kinase/DNA gyrase B/HSP90-like ATPase
MGETRVDLLHLLEDLGDAYTGSLEETILTEVIANSLDSGASVLRFDIDVGGQTLTVLDDGKGMQRADLRRFHDLAASTKVRGEGIGFAGVGVKLSLLACLEVVTETRRGKSHVATTWHLAARHRAPWKWIDPPGLVAEHGTAVRLRLKNPLSPLLDAGFIESVVERHYAPLLDPVFSDFLRRHYPRGIEFQIQGRVLRPSGSPAGRAPISIRMRRRRKPEGQGYLIRTAGLPEEERGVAVSTLGKVIKRGWDWLGVVPASPDRIGGVIEVPALAAVLTLNKADFVRTGGRGATFLQYRKAIQEAVSAQLEAWGEDRSTREEGERRRVRPLERDLKTVLVDLAQDFPMLSSLVERHAGGQRRLPVESAGDGPGRSLTPDVAAGAPEPPESSESDAAGADAENAGSAAPESQAPESATPTPEASADAPVETPPVPVPPEGLLEAAARRRKRPAHFSLMIEEEECPGDPDMARLLETTVRVNTLHPAYHRAETTRSLGYHRALCVAMALAPLAVEPHQARDFVAAFLAHWGNVVDRPGPRRRHRRKGK